MPIFMENGGVLEEITNEETPGTETVTDDNDLSGGKEQEVTEPASELEEGEETVEEGTDTEDDGRTSDGSDTDGKAAQSKEENRRQAAARRQAEAEAARVAAQDDVIKQMNIVNPSTGKPFESYAEYAAAQENSKQSKIREQLERMGVSPEELDKLINEHPAVKEAQKAIEAANAERAAAAEEKENAKFEKLIADVSSVIPEIKDSDSLFKWEHFDKFSLLVRGGISPLEAAKSLSGGARVAASKQAALNSIVSKSHLVKTKATSGGGDYGITDGEYAAMKAAIPGISRKDAAAKIKKYGI